MDGGPFGGPHLVGRRKRRGVEGHAATETGKLDKGNRAAHLEEREPPRSSTSAAGIKPGRRFLGPTRARKLESATAAFGLRMRDGDNQSRVAPGPQAEEHVGSPNMEDSMQEWSVILSVPVELELVVEADTVERAEAEALQWYRDAGHEAALNFAESVSYAEAEVVDSWALKDEAEEEEED